MFQSPIERYSREMVGQDLYGGAKKRKLSAYNLYVRAQFKKYPGTSMSAIAKRWNALKGRKPKKKAKKKAKRKSKAKKRPLTARQREWLGYRALQHGIHPEWRIKELGSEWRTHAPKIRGGGPMLTMWKKRAKIDHPEWSPAKALAEWEYHAEDGFSTMPAWAKIARQFARKRRAKYAKPKRAKAPKALAKRKAQIALATVPPIPAPMIPSPIMHPAPVVMPVQLPVERMVAPESEEERMIREAEEQWEEEGIGSGYSGGSYVNYINQLKQAYPGIPDSVAMGYGDGYKRKYVKGKKNPWLKFLSVVRESMPGITMKKASKIYRRLLGGTISC